MTREWLTMARRERSAHLVEARRSRGAAEVQGEETSSPGALDLSRRTICLARVTSRPPLASAARTAYWEGHIRLRCVVSAISVGRACLLKGGRVPVRSKPCVERRSDYIAGARVPMFGVVGVDASLQVEV